MRPPTKELDGLFYRDSVKIRNTLKKSPQFWGPMPHVPLNNWRPPEFPNLSAAKVIGVDTETYDPELMEAGPGWGRGKGHIIGASLAVEDGPSWYFPIRQGIGGDSGAPLLPPEHMAMNMDPQQVLRFLDHTLHDNRPKVGANLIYDVGWLMWEGVRVNGSLYDIQFAEALLNSEEPDVSLENLSRTHLGVGKVTDILYDWLSSWNGRAANDRQRAWLYMTPPCLAGPYAEADAQYPIKILESQWPKLAARGVLDVFSLECRLIPLLVRMRLKGTPVDVDKANQIYDELGHRVDGLDKRLKDMLGFDVNAGSGQSMTKAFQQLGIPVKKKVSKDTGEESITFDKKSLESIEHPFAELVLEQRGLSKVRDTFVKSYIIEKNVNGRLYCSFHPLKSDKGGTRSGRLASSDPNLQNIPVRTAEGKLVREAFAPKHGGRWRSFDYSSIEYRLLAHFAVGKGADEVRAIFAANPKADYHAIVGDLIFNLAGIKLARGPVKNINFGIIYGMAESKLAGMLKLPKAEASDLMSKYHAAAPYARATMDMCANEVHSTGMVRTILNRVSDFPLWSKKGWSDEGRLNLPYEEAKTKWGMYSIERAMTHKALNRKLQGSAADVMKKAMVDAYEAGLFEEHACGIPSLTVHDELDFEYYGDMDNPAWAELKRTMENCMVDRLRVPLLVEGDVGPNWAAAH